MDTACWGRERQLVLPPLRLHGLHGEWKVDFVDSWTRLGNAQTSLALHSLLPRFCGCAWNGAGAECAGLFDCPDGEIVGRREESCK